MSDNAKELGFWLAIGLWALAFSALAKVAVAKAPLPQGFKELVAAA